MFKGSIVALVTPMLSNGDVDYTQLEALIDFHMFRTGNAGAGYRRHHRRIRHPESR